VRLEPTAAQSAFASRAAAFARDHVRPVAASIDERDEFPDALVHEAGRLGLLGVTAPEAWGGSAQDYTSYVLALEIIARESATMSVILSVSNSLVVEPLLRYGSDAQKERWLPALSAGTCIGAFALSEEEAGSDAANQQTRAIFDGTGYRLSGRKVWVANAVAADMIIVFAVTQPDHDHRRVSAFLVSADAAGIVRTARNDSLGVRGLGCMDLVFDDVHVDSSQLLGPLGHGLTIARWALQGGRIAIAAQALGVGEAALELALAHAKSRKAFGQPIANYQAIQWMLADMATDLEAARVLTHRAAALKDVQEDVSCEASMAKLFASEAAHRAADKSMQIHAAAGYRRGSAVERLFRDVRATEIYQGTSEVQRMVIASHIIAGA
jgi:alkylation response protein AidB-like acyl-CoA dehydrogenase